MAGHAACSRSFSTIRAADIKAAADAGRFWPDALISLNPASEERCSAADLAREGVTLPETGSTETGPDRMAASAKADRVFRRLWRKCHETG